MRRKHGEKGLSEASIKGVQQKKLFIKIPQYSTIYIFPNIPTSVLESLFNKVACLNACNYIKKKL